MTRGALLTVALALIILSIPSRLSVGFAMLGLAVVLALVATAIFAQLTGDGPDWGRLIRRGDYVEPPVAARLRAESDAAAELDERLGVTKAKRPEPRERERSAAGAFAKPWGDRG